MPPSVAITFMEYFEHLWRQTVGKYINSAHIYLVFDKTDLLPPPRSIVHESRSRKVMGSVIPDPCIRDDAAIPHNQTYSSLLAISSSFKKQLLDYVTALFKDKAATVTKEYTLSVTIDSPSLPSVIKVSSGDFFHQGKQSTW